MKLKLFEVDFVKDTITFKVPHKTMENTMWSGGFADVDISEISDIVKESGVAPDIKQPCDFCKNIGLSGNEKKYECPHCGYVLRR